jgi:hypothetical protein
MGWNLIFDGVSAIATAGALVAAIAAGLQAKRLFKIESARDDQAQQAERRRQAAQISAWAAVRIELGGEPLYGIVVRNSSNDPVYDVRISCHGFTTETTPELWCVPGGQYFVENVDTGDPHGLQWDYVRPVSEIRDPVRPFTASDSKGVDQVDFRDNAGLSWRRTARGELSLRNEPQAV